MPELPLGSPTREGLRRALRPQLEALLPGLRWIAEGVLGAEARIDLVGVEPGGRAVLVLVGDEGQDLELLGRAVAQRAWVAARLDDWLQLSPDLGIRPEAEVRVVLLCPSFREEARAAARALGESGIVLARYRVRRSPERLELGLETIFGLEPGTEPADPSRSSPREDAEASASPRGIGPPPFRTGLSDAELGLTPEETLELGTPPAGSDAPRHR